MPLNDTNYSDYNSNRYPICPHCDYLIDIDEHELYELYSEDIHPVECPNCEKDMFITTEPIWRFSTDDQEH